MAYRIRITFTRQSESVEWPFWAADLLGSTYETKASAFQDWLTGRDEADVVFDAEPDGNTVYCDIMFANEDAYDDYTSAWTSAGLEDQFQDQAFLDYCTTNNVTIAHTTENV